MGILSNLAGVSEPAIETATAKSVAEASRKLISSRAVTGADDEGAFNVWRDDDGKYRGEFMRFMITRDKIGPTTKSQVMKWLGPIIERCKRK